LELGEFVEKEDSSVCEADLARLWRRATSDEAGSADGVMGSAKGWAAKVQKLAEISFVFYAHGGSDPENFEALFFWERWEDALQTAGKESFSATRRSRHQ
jgi:hypothetical protein